MISRLLPIIFIVVYATGLLRPLSPFIEFEINRSYIQEVLCINKEEPITVCGGKCYLKIQLEKAQKEKESTKHSFPKVDLSQYPIGFVELLQYSSERQGKIIKNLFSYSNLYVSNYISRIFHPPI